MCDDVTTFGGPEFVTNSCDDFGRKNIVTSSQSSHRRGRSLFFSTNEKTLLMCRRFKASVAPMYTRVPLIGQKPEPTLLLKEEKQYGKRTD